MDANSPSSSPRSRSPSPRSFRSWSDSFAAAAPAPAAAAPPAAVAPPTVMQPPVPGQAIDPSSLVGLANAIRTAMQGGINIYRLRRGNSREGTIRADRLQELLGVSSSPMTVLLTLNVALSIKQPTFGQSYLRECILNAVWKMYQQFPILWGKVFSKDSCQPYTEEYLKAMVEYYYSQSQIQNLNPNLLLSTEDVKNIVLSQEVFPFRLSLRTSALLNSKVSLSLLYSELLPLVTPELLRTIATTQSLRPKPEKAARSGLQELPMREYDVPRSNAAPVPAVHSNPAASLIIQNSRVDQNALFYQSLLMAYKIIDYGYTYPVELRHELFYSTSALHVCINGL